MFRYIKRKGQAFVDLHAEARNQPRNEPERDRERERVSERERL